MTRTRPEVFPPPPLRWFKLYTARNDSCTFPVALPTSQHARDAIPTNQPNHRYGYWALPSLVQQEGRDR